MQVLPSHVDDLDLIPVGELDDLLVEVEEDILTLTLAVQGLVGQTEMGSSEKLITVHNCTSRQRVICLAGIVWLLLSKTTPISYLGKCTRNHAITYLTHSSMTGL